MMDQLRKDRAQRHDSPTKHGAPAPTTGARARAIGLISGLALLLALIAPMPRAAAAPAPITGPTAGGTEVSDLVPGVKFTQVAAGSGHSTALSTDGDVYTWGLNQDGELGDGTTDRHPTPQKVAMPSGVTATQISAGGMDTAALGSDGGVYLWGINQYGQMGDGTWKGGLDDDHLMPTRAHTPAGVKFTQVDTSGAHTVALDTEGNAYAWGLADEGQLGNGQGGHGTVLLVSPSPQRVVMPEGVHFTHVCAGETATIAIGSDGNAWFWGALSSETRAGRNKPERLSLPGGAHPTDVSVGGAYALIVASDGATYQLGRDLSGSSGTNSAPGRWSWDKLAVPGVVTSPRSSLQIATSLLSTRRGTHTAGA